MFDKYNQRRRELYLDLGGFFVDLNYFERSVSAISLISCKAKMDSSPSASMLGQVGVLTFDMKATVKKLTNPSFPVSAGYLLVYSIHPSGRLALVIPRRKRCERSPVAISISVGLTAEIPFELSFRYQVQDVMERSNQDLFRN